MAKNPTAGALLDAATPRGRKTAEERREDVLEAAREDFAEHGLSGASTDAIARKAGISQPYLFRLFGTKKELFLAAIERCFAETLETFQAAAGGQDRRGGSAGDGRALPGADRSDRRMLRARCRATPPCDDPDVWARSRRRATARSSSSSSGSRASTADTLAAVLRPRDAMQRLRRAGPARCATSRGRSGARGFCEQA